MMDIVPITIRVANAYVGAMHRHHGQAQGCKFALGAEKNGELVGVAIIGRPVARTLDDGHTAEVTRLCTNGTRNACSALYGAAARAAREMGYAMIITYILASESGISLKATGWSFDCEAGGGSWTRTSRPRSDKHPTEPKQRWSKRLRVIEEAA